VLSLGSCCILAVAFRLRFCSQVYFSGYRLLQLEQVSSFVKRILVVIDWNSDLRSQLIALLFLGRYTFPKPLTEPRAYAPYVLPCHQTATCTCRAYISVAQKVKVGNVWLHKAALVTHKKISFVCKVLDRFDYI